MKHFLIEKFAWLVDQLLCLFVSLTTGIRPQDENTLHFSTRGKVYYANHASHGDFLLVWISLPHRWRKHARPVAAAEYWLSGPIRRFIIQRVFNAVLVPRQTRNPDKITEQLYEPLHQGDSLIIFPEGTRNMHEQPPLLPFKSGIFHLAKHRPETEFIPLWINNISRVLPKGKYLPVPLLCQVTIGDPLMLSANEEKRDFLQRAQAALLALAPTQLHTNASLQAANHNGDPS